MAYDNIIPLRSAAARPRGESTPLPDSPPVNIVGQIEARLRDDRPDLYRSLRDGIRPIRRPTLGGDFRELVGEVRASPVSHALVGLAAIIGWTLLLVAPLWFGWVS